MGLPTARTCTSLPDLVLLWDPGQRTWIHPFSSAIKSKVENRQNRQNQETDRESAGD